MAFQLIEKSQRAMVLNGNPSIYSKKKTLHESCVYQTTNTETLLAKTHKLL